MSRLFLAAYPYGADVLALPVVDVDASAAYYATTFGMREVERRDAPRAVVMERDGVRIGFAENGGDPAQEGAAVRVADIHAARAEIEAAGTKTGNWRVDDMDGVPHQVFFVVAPDGLCYYFHQPLAEAGGSKG